MYLKFGKKRNATKRRMAKYKNEKKLNIKSIIKIQLLAKRFLLRKRKAFEKENETFYDESKVFYCKII